MASGARHPAGGARWQGPARASVAVLRQFVRHIRRRCTARTPGSIGYHMPVLAQSAGVHREATRKQAQEWKMGAGAALSVTTTLRGGRENSGFALTMVLTAVLT